MTDAITPPVCVAPGETFDLRVQQITKTINGRELAMLGYNGAIPGPTLRVRQGSEILVTVTNETPMDTTVHWHGLRLDNAFDGVPNTTQSPIPPGGTYTHRLTFPDAGLFWYHPHIREDLTQEMGLYGNVLVDPVDASYWPPADRDVVLTLDDLLVEDGAIAPFDPNGATFTAMGRFGNVLLAAGQTQLRLPAETDEIVRLWLTNTANTRVFRVALPGVQLKLVGGDAGRYEREEWVDDVVIAPSERAVLDARFDRAGTFTLEHRTPGHRATLASFQVAQRSAARAPDGFADLRHNADLATERTRVAPWLDAAPDKVLALVAEMDFADPDTDGAVVYVCAMHPQVVQDAPGSCPLCGMKLMPQAADAHHSAAPHAHDDAALADGIEWEDLMVELNRTTNTQNMRWQLIDRDTDAVNSAIDWSFDQGDQIKLRLVNELESDHPMHHPFHVHGERFLVLARDGVAEPNLVWKDTVLVRTGQTVDLLMDASNPGRWMAHCHIAEHMEDGMAFTFTVRPVQGG